MIIQSWTYREQYGFNSVIILPANLYGPHDNFQLDNSHVIPALLRKVVLAKKNNDPFVTVWGTGKPRRDFLNVDDLANACYLLMNEYDDAEPINIGSGRLKESSINLFSFLRKFL